MKQEFSMERFLKKLRSDRGIRALGMPMEYQPGLPVIRNLRGTTCLTVPFLKRKIAKKVRPDGGTFEVVETYPIRFSVTYALRAVELPELGEGKAAMVLAGDPAFLEKTITEGKLIAFEDLSYRPDYTLPGKDHPVPVDRDLPVGVFTAGAKAYTQLLGEIYECYDQAIHVRLYEGKIDGTLENRLLHKLTEALNYEPAIRPFYRLLDGEFFGRKLAGLEEST